MLRSPGDFQCEFATNDRIVRILGDDRIVAGARTLSDVATLRGGEVLPVIVRRGRSERSTEMHFRWVDRRTRVSRVVASGLVAALLLAVPVALLLRSPARAAAPFSLLYAAVSVIAVIGTTGRGSSIATAVAIAAAGILPAAIVHLGLTFPRERRVIVETPRLVFLPYAVTAFFWPYGWLVFRQSPILWPSYLYLLMGVMALAWATLLLSCLAAFRESESAVERARARLLCLGSFVLPLAPSLSLLGGDRGIADIATGFVWVSTVVLPVPIGLAISQYNLFSLDWDVRRWISHVVYLVAAATIVMVILEFSILLVGREEQRPDISLALLVAFGCAGATDLVRAIMVPRVERWIAPGLSRVRELRTKCLRALADERDEAAILRRLIAAIQEMAPDSSGSLYLTESKGWRLVDAFGSRVPIAPGLAEEAFAVLREQTLVHVPQIPEGSRPSRELEHSVEVIAAFKSSGKVFGLVLLAASREGSFGDPQLDFVARICEQATVGLRNCYLTEELIDSERHAAVGRAAVSFAHDLGKELDWLYRLVKRLPNRIDDRSRLLRDIGMIQELSDSLVSGAREFVKTEHARAAAGAALCSADEAIASSVDKMTRIHGPDRIVETIEPAVRAIQIDRGLSRVLSNLLDNALLATASSDAVQIHATIEGGWLRVAVLDRGFGIPADFRERIFEPGFSTRSESGGLGVGLTVSRQIAAEMGGTLSVEEREESGISAVVRVPVLSHSEPAQSLEAEEEVRERP